MTPSGKGEELLKSMMEIELSKTAEVREQERFDVDCSSRWPEGWKMCKTRVSSSNETLL